METKTTPVKSPKPRSLNAFSSGLFAAAFLAMFRFFLLIIPPVAILVLLTAVIALLFCVLRKDVLNKFRGRCPHCNSEVKVDARRRTHSAGSVVGEGWGGGDQDSALICLL